MRLPLLLSAPIVPPILPNSKRDLQSQLPSPASREWFGGHFSAPVNEVLMKTERFYNILPSTPSGEPAVSMWNFLISTYTSEDVITGKEIAVIHATVEYLDIFDKRHHTRAVYAYLDKKLQFQPQHAEYT
jgi:hypothetical protein